jgi:hypothetical protein
MLYLKLKNLSKEKDELYFWATVVSRFVYIFKIDHNKSTFIHLKFTSVKIHRIFCNEFLYKRKKKFSLSVTISDLICVYLL